MYLRLEWFKLAIATAIFQRRANNRRIPTVGILFSETLSVQVQTSSDSRFFENFTKYHKKLGPVMLFDGSDQKLGQKYHFESFFELKIDIDKLVHTGSVGKGGVKFGIFEPICTSCI